ncbi:Activating transcription factor 7-interacting protein 1 [Folsomia candida]|uniref:Activating transcription factor 7-interacting protein 1 n=1 Tax=Folsomia candida TaxID=158441 RepID=A0A226F215_FOLCA|nr:Activating transcription factor 7-interacting protein 1 [Folsomia candida]
MSPTKCKDGFTPEVITLDDAPYEILESPSSKKIRGEPLLDEGQISSSYYLKQILSSPNKVEVKRMSREELEDLVLCKVAQVLLHDTEEGKYRMKIMGLEKQRDRLKDRVIALGKQVMEMEKAVSLLLHEALKAENTRSILRPIKLYRSVGLQVDTGKAPSKLAQQKAIAPKQNLVTRSCQTNSTPVCQAETQTDISQYPKPPAKNGTTRSKIVAEAVSRSTNFIHKTSPNTLSNPKKNADPMSLSTTPGRQNHVPRQTNNVTYQVMQEPNSGRILQLVPYLPNASPKLTHVRPSLSLARNRTGGITLSWQMPQSVAAVDMAGYEIFSLYKSKAGKEEWKRIAEVERGKRHSFTVRGKGVYGRGGPFSVPQSILVPKPDGSI